MHRITLLTVFAAVFAAIALAQSDNPFNRPPADVDQALRARINEFYDLHIKGLPRKAEALVIAHQIEKEGTAGGEEFALAVIYTGLGDYDRAITQVERGVATRSLLPFTLVDPMLDPLQALPQFKALLAKMNLPSDESAR